MTNITILCNKILSLCSMKFMTKADQKVDKDFANSDDASVAECHFDEDRLEVGERQHSSV